MLNVQDLEAISAVMAIVHALQKIRQKSLKLLSGQTGSTIPVAIQRLNTLSLPLSAHPHVDVALKLANMG